MQQVHEDKEKRNWQPVDKLLDLIQKQYTLTSSAPSPSFAVLRAEVQLAKDLPKDAEKSLNDCAAQFPKNAQVWLALINLPMYLAEKETDPAEKEKLWNQASENIDRAEKSIGDRAILRSARGTLAIRRKDPQAVAVLKRLGENLDKMTDAEKKQLWGNLGAFCTQAGALDPNALDLGRSYYRLLAEKDPANIVIRYLLCDLNLRAYEKGQTADLPELDKLLNEIEQLGGQGPYWLYAKAIRTLVKSNKKDPKLLLEARGYLQDALKVRKDWAALAVLAGKICEMQDEPDQALEFYVNAIYRMRERDNDVIRRTLALLMPRGRIDEAGQLFDYLEKQKSPLLGEMAPQYALWKVYRGDIAAAEKEVDKSVPAGSKDYRDFLRQGQMYSVLADREKRNARIAYRNGKPDAEAEIKRASAAMIRLAQKGVNALLHAQDLEPKADDVWVSLFQLLVNVGQADKAQPLIDRAEAALKGENAPLTLAACCELMKGAYEVQAKAEEAAAANAQATNEDRAKALQGAKEQRQWAVYYAKKTQAKFEEAAKASPQNSHVLRRLAAFYLRNAKLDPVEPLLKQIIALQTPATLTDACWARHVLADLVVSRGDFDHLCQGMALIDENLRSPAASLDDKRMKVRLLISDPRKEKIGEAIAAMEDLVQGTDATHDDYFNLAKLYLRKGDWPNYSKQMHSVLGTQKGGVQPGLLIFYVNSLLEKKELDDADKWLETLEKEKSTRNLFDTVRLRAEYQFLRGNYQAAANLAMGFLDNSEAQPTGRGQQLLLVASLMEKFGDRLKAAGKRADASAFQESADRFFTALRSKRVAETGDLHYAAYLARQKRIRECLDVLEQCWDKSKAENLRVPAEEVIHAKATDAQYQQLEKILVAASNRSDRPVALLLVLADLHAQIQQHDKSMADYRDVLAKAPRNYVALNNLGVSLARSGRNLDEALKLVNDALAIRGPLAAVLDSRAIVYIARQEYEKALEDMAAAIQDEGTAEQYFHQAWAYSLAGKKSEASEAFATAMKKGLSPMDLDPREVPVYNQLKSGL